MEDLKTINPNSKVEITYRELKDFEKLKREFNKWESNEVEKWKAKFDEIEANPCVVVREYIDYYHIEMGIIKPPKKEYIIEDISRKILRDVFDRKNNDIVSLMTERDRLKEKLDRIPTWIKKWYKVD